ncbi:hypothetical protein [Halobaculum sp. MBLA0143]|uniref:DUF7718 family protein n=1 Tax=Halobaculum sp. MBLA0143 TaxID=3079933 RepID=UPI003523C43F
MNRYTTIDLGEYRGDNYFLTSFVEPDPDDYDDYTPAENAENYGWVVVQKAESPIDDNNQVVRMDTRHEGPHLDKEYLSSDSDEDDKIRLDDGYSFLRMRDYLLANWEQFVDLYITNNE